MKFDFGKIFANLVSFTEKHLEDQIVEYTTIYDDGRYTRWIVTRQAFPKNMHPMDIVEKVKAGLGPHETLQTLTLTVAVEDRPIINPPTPSPSPCDLSSPDPVTHSPTG